MKPGPATDPVEAAAWDERLAAAREAEAPWEPMVAFLGDDADRAQRVRRWVVEARHRARLLHEAGAGGGEVVRVWTRWMDHAVVGLFRAALREHGDDLGRVSLLALGGYGREELSPQSDLDILVLQGHGADLTSLVEKILYPLWDAGLDVQCVARTPEENLRVAREDSRSRTSLLEGRFLEGTRGLFAGYERLVLEQEIFGRGVRPFVEGKLAEMEARHERFGSTVYLLEPNVKEGPGGLRDIHTALWVAKVRFKARSPDELLQRGAVPPGELAALQEAREFLLRVRNHLHFLAGRREDRLTYEFQDEAAPFFGYPDDGTIPGVERFLQAYYECANRVTHFAGAVIRRATAGLVPRPQAAGAREVVPGVRVRRGEVYLSPPAVEKRPLAMLEAFEVAQTHGVDLSPEALEVIRANLHRVDDRFRRDPHAVELFLKILRHPRRVATTLLRMHDVRFLDRFIPEFSRIFCRVQRELNHCFPVDVHSLFAVQELRRIARGEYAEEFPLLTRLSGELERPDILYLAALLHDVGKGEGGGAHAERGGEIALAVGERMGLTPRDREDLVFLVEKHLVLSRTAQGRDLHDEDLIRAFAQEVGEAERLKMIYLLTVADIRAVGPGAWTAWKDLLFRELYEKALRALESREGTDRKRARERVEAVRERLRRLLAAEPPAEVEAFLSGVEHPQYLLANPLDALARHFAAFKGRGKTPVISFRPVTAQGYTEVLVVARDRPGLFAEIAGLLAAHRINVLSAVLNTREDGWVVDCLHVSGPAGDDLEEQRREGWRRDVEDVLAGRKTLGQALGDRLRPRGGLPRRRPAVPTRIRVDQEASQRFTVVDLQTADRVGLLYDVARTLAAQGLNLRLAKIATTLEQVLDSFYVETAEGEKLLEPSRVAALEQALEAVVNSGGQEVREE